MCGAGLVIDASMICCAQSSRTLTTSGGIRLYCDANLAVCRPKNSKRALNERVSLQLVQTVNEVWSTWTLSQIACQTVAGIKCLTVADDFSHECVDIVMGYCISSNEQWF